MDNVITNLELKKDTALASSRNLALNLIRVIDAVTKGKGNDTDREKEEIYESLRVQLFLKYAMIDFESHSQSIHKLGKLK